MIAIPRLIELPFEATVLGGLGCALGRFNDSNDILFATLLATASIANQILFQIIDRSVDPKLKISHGAIYIGTSTLVSVVTILAARELELLSRRSTCFLLVGSFAVLLSRLKILST